MLGKRSANANKYWQTQLRDVGAYMDSLTSQPRPANIGNGLQVLPTGRKTLVSTRLLFRWCMSMGALLTVQEIQTAGSRSEKEFSSQRPCQGKTALYGTYLLSANKRGTARYYFKFLYLHQYHRYAVYLSQIEILCTRSTRTCVTPDQTTNKCEASTTPW